MFPVTNLRRIDLGRVSSSLCIGGYLGHPCANRSALLAQIKEHPLIVKSYPLRRLLNLHVSIPEVGPRKSRSYLVKRPY